MVTTGPSAYRALEAAQEMDGKAGVYNFRYVKPLDEDMLDMIASSYEAILTVEDGSLKGGLYGAVCEYLSGSGKNIVIEGIGIPNRFIPQGSQKEERHECGLDKDGICERIEEILSKF